jgi:hypothetical protein
MLVLAASRVMLGLADVEYLTALDVIRIHSQKFFSFFPALKDALVHRHHVDVIHGTGFAAPAFLAVLLKITEAHTLPVAVLVLTHSAFSVS